MFGTLIRTGVSVAKKALDNKKSSSSSSNKSNSSVSSSKSSSRNTTNSPSLSTSNNNRTNNTSSKRSTSSVQNSTPIQTPNSTTSGVQFNQGVSDATKQLLTSIVGSKYYDPNYNKASAKQLARPNKSGTDHSGVLINDKPASVNQARATNPLYDVNQSRQQSILNALVSGDWTDYRNSQARQAPMHYEQGADGNYTQNKNYYANLVESSLNAMREAEKEGDRERAEAWRRSLQERIAQYNEAPGMAVYIPRLHSSDLGQEFGIIDYDPNYVNSEFNNNLARTQGVTERRMWYDNPLFQDNPELAEEVIRQGQSLGTEEQKQARASVNAGYNAIQTPTPPLFTDPSNQFVIPQIQQPIVQQPIAPQQNMSEQAILEFLRELEESRKREQELAEERRAYDASQIRNLNNYGDGTYLFGENPTIPYDATEEGRQASGFSIEKAQQEAYLRYLENVFGGKVNG